MGFGISNGMLHVGVCTRGPKTLTVAEYGISGDGSTDETVRFQEALMRASGMGDTLIIPTGYVIRVTAPLYLWGSINLQGPGSILFDGVDLSGGGYNTYCMNIGISGLRSYRSTFSGILYNFGILLDNSTIGRIIQFWRTNGATMDAVRVALEDFNASGTGSGNDDAWCQSAYYERANLTVKNCVVTGTSTNAALSQEGIGLNWFTGGLVIDGNTVTGVADDAIAIHNCLGGTTVTDNVMSSLDGGLASYCSQTVTATGNTISRALGAASGSYLMNISFETFTPGAGETYHYAPTAHTITGNTLIYPSGSPNDAKTVYLRANRDTVFSNNIIQCNSASVTCVGVQLTAEPMGADWADPDSLDTVAEVEGPDTGVIVAKGRNITLSGNNLCAGTTALSMDMSGSRGRYYPEYYDNEAGTPSTPNSLIVTNNTASAFAIWYGDWDVTDTGNTTC